MDSNNSLKTTSSENRTYSVIPYQKKWQKDFEESKKRLVPVFGKRAVEILHVGSTAIVGMAGKPTIDVLIVVDSIASVDEVNGPMAELGYVALGEYVGPNSRLFAKEEDGERLVNVHCYERLNPHAQEMITMRDFLRTHPDEADAYADLKIGLYAKHPNDYKAYRHFKDPYLRELRARAMGKVK